MNTDVLSDLALLSVPVFALGGLVLAFWSGRFITCGIAIAVALMLPLIAQSVFTDSDAPGLAFPAMLGLLEGAGLCAIGSALAAFRWAARQHRKLVERSAIAATGSEA